MIKINLVILFLTFFISIGQNESLANGQKPEKQKSIELEKKQNLKCPKCQTLGNIVPIVYGYPGPELLKESQKGKVMLGGCIVTGNDPAWFCRKCQNRW